MASLQLLLLANFWFFTETIIYRVQQRRREPNIHVSRATVVWYQETRHCEAEEEVLLLPLLPPPPPPPLSCVSSTCATSAITLGKETPHCGQISRPLLVVPGTTPPPPPPPPPIPARAPVRAAARAFPLDIWCVASAWAMRAARWGKLFPH